MISRRMFVQSLAAMATVACPVCRAAFAAETPHWNYEEAAHWGDLSPDFRVCDVGHEQSPIDLDDPIPSAIGDLSFDWKPTQGTLVNNGHTIQVDVPAGNKLRIGGASYDLKQFHFHHPSEHTVKGAALPLEAHFVHANDSGLAVIGVFLVAGASNAALGQVFAKMPSREGEVEIGNPIDLATLLPRSRAYYRYAGSLTTPPCSETVLWTVFADSVEAGKEQIDAFAAIFPMNARPAQKLNRRFLLGSF